MILVVLLCGVLGAADAQAVNLPEGQTRLSDIGIYRVGYTYTDGRSGVMPLGWVGHFHEPTGISYTPHGQQDGRACLLIHCPWRNGTGITYVEYALRLPRAGPIKLELAIAMKSDVIRPDRSDGCDFRASVKTPDGKAHVLLDEHYAAAEWKPLSFELTPYAGKRITLRLETGPGPKKDASWDYSLFGDPRIVVGQAPAPQVVQPIWPEPADLTRLSDRSDIACCPTGPPVGKTSLHWDEDSGVTRYDVPWPADKGRIAYTVRTRQDGQHAAESFIDVSVSVTRPDGRIGPAYRMGVGSAIVLTDGKRSWESNSPDVRVQAVRSKNRPGPERFDGVLAIETDYAVASIRARVRREFRLCGASLVATVSSPHPAISEVRFGRISAPLRRGVSVPYLGLGPIWYLPDSQLFHSVVLDWTNSRATHHDESAAHYAAMTDASRNPVTTTVYYTFSPRIGDVLCNLPFKPSPFLADLAGRIMFDVWGGKFRDDASWFETLASYGVGNAVIIKHVWQRSGYDNALPNHVPANKDLGGDDGMLTYVGTTRALGYRTSLHENYVDFYPNSELYDANDVALDPSGRLVKAWFNAGTRVQSYAVKPTAIMKYARMQSPEIHRRYGTNAAYLDVHTCVPPWFHVDHRAGERGAATFAAVFNAHAELFAFERQTHGGPLFGEGNNQFFWAGLCDGCEAQVANGEDSAWLVDFDLLKIHPQMVNHGMGYLERWLSSGYSGGWSSQIPSTRAMDKYRAMALAFGHAGFVAQQIWHHVPFVLREYYLVTPIQKRYVTARPRKILYDVGGTMLPASQALATEPISNRVYVEYDSGLKLWCNGSEREWRIPAGVLCDYGFRAEADDLLATTTTWPTTDRKKVVADFRRADDVIFADARCHESSPLTAIVDVEPSTKAFEPAGPRRLKITYQWQVGKSNPGKWRCYVHFTSPRAPGPDQIVFQNDHALPKPVAQWKAGETIADGPHEVAVPADAPDGDYDLVIGLFDDTGRAVLPFRPDGRGRYAIGTLTVKGDAVTFVPRKLDAPPAGQGLGPYNGHTNPDRAMVDFGPVATNGCVAIERIYGAWRVTIFPRDESFRIRVNMAKIEPDAPPGPWKVEMLNENRRSHGFIDAKIDGELVEWTTGQERINYYHIGK